MEVLEHKMTTWLSAQSARVLSFCALLLTSISVGPRPLATLTGLQLRKKHHCLRPCPECLPVPSYPVARSDASPGFNDIRYTVRTEGLRLLRFQGSGLLGHRSGCRQRRRWSWILRLPGRFLCLLLPRIYDITLWSG